MVLQRTEIAKKHTQTHMCAYVYIRTLVCKCACDSHTPKLRASWEMSRDPSGARTRTNIHRRSPFAGRGSQMRCWDCSIKEGGMGIGDCGLNGIGGGGTVQNQTYIGL